MAGKETEHDCYESTLFSPQVLLRLILQLKHRQTCIYFIETAPSLLREVSYLKFIDYKVLNQHFHCNVLARGSR